MNTHAWLSRCAVLLALVGCGGTDGPADSSPPSADGGDADTGSAPLDGGDADGGCSGLDDGIDCTMDICVDGVAQHGPDDDACASLASGPFCDTTGRIAQDFGVCDLAMGCVADTRLVEDCTETTPSAACTGSASTGDLAFWEPTSLCDDGSGVPACEQPSTPCETTTPPACSAGMLTTAIATCEEASGCGETAETSACEVRPPRCEGPTFITYSPSCADATSCSLTGAEDRAPCPTPPVSCVGQVHTTWAATCDSSTGCGTAPALENDCSAMNSRVCWGGAGTTTTTCRCDVATGCSCSSSSRLCPLPIGLTSTCLDAVTRRYQSVECAGAGVCSTVTRMETCPGSCCTVSPTRATCC